MEYAYIQNNGLTVKWTVRKAGSKALENFSGAKLQGFVIGENNVYAVSVSASGGVLTMNVGKTLQEGAYSLKVVWLKNWKVSVNEDYEYPTETCQCMTPEMVISEDDIVSRTFAQVSRDGAFYVTNTARLDTIGGVLELEDRVDAFGYDGLSAYEIAVLRGVAITDEKAWVTAYAQHLNDLTEEIERWTPVAEAIDTLETVTANAVAAKNSANNAASNANTAAGNANTAANNANTATANANAAKVSMNSLSQSVSAAESARVSAESARVSAENSRVGAESARVSAESARVVAENARVAAEEGRAAVLAGKVDKVSGKGLSTNDYTDADKTKVDKMSISDNDVVCFDALDINVGGLGGSDGKTIGDMLDGKVDKESGKGLINTNISSQIEYAGAGRINMFGTVSLNGKEIATKDLLSTNDYTDNDVISVRNGIPALGSRITSVESGKVDKVSGKGLSSNDYTDAEKSKVASALTQHQDISGKVDKVDGKGLSSNDYTDADLAEVEKLKSARFYVQLNTDRPNISYLINGHTILIKNSNNVVLAVILPCVSDINASTSKGTIYHRKSSPWRIVGNLEENKEWRVSTWDELLTAYDENSIPLSDITKISDKVDKSNGKGLISTAVADEMAMITFSAPDNIEIPEPGAEPIVTPGEQKKWVKFYHGIEVTEDFLAVGGKKLVFNSDGTVTWTTAEGTTHEIDT